MVSIFYFVYKCINFLSKNLKKINVGSLTDQHFREIMESIKVDEYLENNTNDSLQCLLNLSSPCINTCYDSKAIQCSDLPIQDCEKIPPGM